MLVIWESWVKLYLKGKEKYLVRKKEYGKKKRFWFYIKINFFLKVIRYIFCGGGKIGMV